MNLRPSRSLKPVAITDSTAIQLAHVLEGLCAQGKVYAGNADDVRVVCRSL